MSTPTPIEIVREFASREHGTLLMAAGERDRDWRYYASALASVLADAERFQALERAHRESKWSGWDEWNPAFGGFEKSGPLAELADRLRDGAT